MINYNLGSMVARKSGRTMLPAIHGFPAIQAQLLAAFRVNLRALNKAVALDIVPEFEREMAKRATPQPFTGDVDGASFEAIAKLGEALGKIASSTVSNILNLGAQRHTTAFMTSAKQALGVDLAAVVQQDDLGSYLQQAATRNAGLIKGMNDAVVNRIQSSVMSAVLNGKSVKELKKQLAADFGFGDNRAKLIARDQTAKLNSDLNRFRHQQAGINFYEWMTSEDERVRPRHRACNGVVYEYGKPTGAEDGLPPGQPVQCRCIARAIVTFGTQSNKLTHGSKFEAESVELEELTAANVPPVGAVAPATMTPAEKKAAYMKEYNAKKKAKATLAPIEAPPPPALPPPPVDKPPTKAELAAKKKAEKAAKIAANNAGSAKIWAEYEAKKAASKAEFLAAQASKAAAKPVPVAKKFTPKGMTAAEQEAKIKATLAAAEKQTAEKVAKAKAEVAATKTLMKEASDLKRPKFIPVEKSYSALSKEFAVTARGETHAVVQEYTGSGYRGMNATLRRGQTTSKIDLMKKAIDESPVPNDMLVYRGIGQVSDVVPGVKDVTKLLGATIEDKGFVSVASDPGVSERFARSNNDNPPPPPLMTSIRLRKGQKALHNGANKLRVDETELIMQAGTRFRVVEVTPSGYVSKYGIKMDHVVLEVLEDGE